MLTALLAEVYTVSPKRLERVVRFGLLSTARDESRLVGALWFGDE